MLTGVSPEKKKMNKFLESMTLPRVSGRLRFVKIKENETKAIRFVALCWRGRDQSGFHAKSN